MHSLDVGIIGTGTAGSAAALFLSRQGHRVTVYERVPEPAPVGAGIMLQPSGMSVLTELGLVDAVVARGERISRLVCETRTGQRILELAYGDLAPDLYGVGLHRGVLFDALFTAVKNTPAINLQLGLEVEDLQRLPRGRQAVIEKHTRRALGAHELIVVADGARSQLRDDTAIRKKVARYPWGALWAVLPDPQHRFTERLYQVVDGTRTLIGMLPTGLGPTGSVPHTSLFFSLPVEGVAAFRRGDFGLFAEALVRTAPAAEPLISQLHRTDELLFSEYADIVMWPWNTERLVYLGDAAHATSPQLGQGCNLALVDASVLARCIERSESVPDALFAYSRERRAHLGWYQFITRWLTPFFQSDFTVLGPLRDTLMAQSTRLPLVRRLMVAGMAGIANWPGLPMHPLAHRPPRHS